MNKKITVGVSVILGILFIVLAFIYVRTPAGALPTYIPGFEAGVAKIHYKHGIASFILGLALFAFAWFTSGSPASDSHN